MNNLGMVLRAQGKLAEAEMQHANDEGKMRNAFRDANAYRLAFLLSQLGKARAHLAKDAGSFIAAEANLLEAHEIYGKTPGPSPKDCRACVQALVDFYTRWDQADPERGHDAQRAEWQAKLEKRTEASPPESIATDKK